jgi:hypothetical protein
LESDPESIVVDTASRIRQDLSAEQWSDLIKGVEYAMLEPVLTFTESESTTDPKVEELAAHLPAPFGFRHH